MIASLFYSACLILIVIGRGMTFEKANIPWWTSIVPIYNCYITAKIAGKMKWFIAQVIVCIITFIAIFADVLYFSVYNTVKPESGYLFDSQIFIEVIVICLILAVFYAIQFVINVAVSIGVANAYGYSFLFGIGLAVIPYVFWMILGFSCNIRYERKSFYKNQEKEYYIPENGYKSCLNFGKQDKNEEYRDSSYYEKEKH